MNYSLTHQQANGLLEALDITIKKIGLQGVYTVTELASLLQTPESENETHYGYQISEEQVKAFESILDITVKEVGLQAAGNITQILEALKNPLPEVVAAPEEAE